MSLTHMITGGRTSWAWWQQKGHACKSLGNCGPSSMPLTQTSMTPCRLRNSILSMAWSWEDN
eukprot:8443975-Karenia_brevis.AAC.1